MAPKVLTAYTCPIALSLVPLRMSKMVMSGKVIPAAQVAGNITSSEMAALPRL